MRHRGVSWLGALTIWLASLAVVAGMSVVPTDFDRLVTQAETIFRGRVETVAPAWEGEGTQRHLVTYVTVRVEESFFGRAEGRQTLRFFGGRLDGRVQRIVGMPEFRPGDEEILFVRGNRKDLCPLVGLHHGRLRVQPAAGTAARRQVLLHDGTPLADLAQIGKSAERQRPALGAVGALTPESFGEKIRAALRERGREPDPR